MRRQIFLLSILFLILLQVQSQDADSQAALTIGQGLDIQLQPAVFKQFNVVVNNRSSSKDDLFIHIAPKLADPFQVPYLSITADKGYEQHCFNAHAEFAGVCRIKAQDIDKYKSFILVVRCITTCNLHIETYFSQVVKLQVGSSIELAAHQDIGLSQMVHVEVPQTEYTSLAVMAVITNMQQRLQFGQQGVDIYVNYGPKDTVQDPTEQKFQIRGSSVNGAGKGAFIYRDNIQPTHVIRTYVKLAKGIKIKFTVIALKGDQFNIELGGSYYDYATKQSNKIYTLDTTKYSSSLQNKTIQIVFDVYSGSPQFKISFNHQFSQIVEYTRQSTAVNVIISPQTRLKYKFNNTLFIKVVTNTTCEYYFSAQVIRDDAIYIQPYITYFDQIQTNNVQNYILFQRYKQPVGTVQKKNFSFKIEILRGKGNFYFKRCPNLQLHAYNDPNLEHCFIRSSNQLQQPQFLNDQIQNKHITSGNFVTIFMPFDISECNHESKNQGFINYLCAFDIIAVGQSSEIFEFSIVFERKYLSNYLREGKLIKQYIPKGNYAYYVFSLPDIETVQQINIFLTAFSGDVALIVSNTDKLPNLNSTLKQAGSKCNIILQKNDIAKQIYLSVYAYQYTQINLGVVVHRSQSPGSVHQIPLEDGNIQNYILNKTQPTAFFIIRSKEISQITVFINEVLGNAKMTVLDQNKKTVKCKNIPQDRLLCLFTSEKNKNYTVKVQNKSIQVKFSITYKSQEGNCFSGNLNHPIYVSIPSQQSQCYTFNLNRQIDLQFASSFTHLQILDKQIITNLRFNQKDYAVIGSHHTITLSNQNEVCQIGLKSGGFPKTCRVSINFQNKASNTNTFSFILEEQDADIALFDGVSQRIKGQNAQSQDGKRFYYHVKSEKSIILFFSTQSLKSHYYLSAKFIANDQFLSRNQAGKDIYPGYVEYSFRSHPQKIEKRENKYTATLGMTGLQVISIEKEAINEFCPNLECYFVVSVYPQAYQNQIETDEDFYQIQITQQETVLPLAQSKAGVVNKGDIYTYIVDPQDAVVELKYLSQQKCLTFQGAKYDGTVVKKSEFRKDMQVSKADKIQRIFVKGKQDGCSFAISYLSNTNPYRIVRLSHPYQVEVEKGQLLRFIYYHHNPRSFKIAPMTSAGIINVYVKPIKQQDFTLSSLSNLKLKDYPFHSNDGQFTIMQEDKNFCSNCYYYILVTSQTRFVGQVVFLRLYDPIPLATNHIFKQHLVPLTVLGVQNYLYYSLTQFNLTFNMLSGKIGIAIIDPSGFTVVTNDQIDTKQSYAFKAMDYSQKDPVELYSQRARYTIRVNVIEEAEYYIEVKKQHTSQRLFEGFPANIVFKQQATQTVEFINSQDLDKPLNLMINIQQNNKSSQTILTFTFRGQKNNGQALPSDQLLKKIVKSDNTYMLSLLNFKGRYYIDIKSLITASATLILVKNTLTHISPKQNYLFNTEGVYQVYSNYKKVMVQVFNCQGELDLIGSKDERDMQQNFNGQSPLQIKRPNYGGHYIFNIEQEFPSYYIKIKNKVKETPIQYLVNYYYYEEVNPYDAIDSLNYQVTYQNQSNGLTLIVNPPAIISTNPNIKIVKVIYTAYLSNNKLDLNRYSRCLIEGSTFKKNQGSPSILIENKIIEQVKGKDNKMYATVQASIQIQLQYNDMSASKNFPNLLTIFYNTIEIGAETKQILVQKKYTYWFTDSFTLFIGWMALPFILSAATLYYIIKYFTRRLMMTQANMVEQIEIIPSNQTVPTEQKIGQAPQSGTQIVKQHI